MKRNRLLLVLTFAMTCGVLAGGLSLRMLRDARAAEPQAPAAATVQILVAARDLPPGTTITEADLRPASWPQGSLPQGHASEAGTLVGRMVTATVAAGQPVVQGAIASDGVGLPAVIPAGMRAVSIRIDDVAGVSGFISAGSRVDVLATVDNLQGGSESATRIVLQDVQVAAVGREMKPSADGAPVEATVATLLVGPEGAEQLVLASNRGKVQLALRGNRDREAVRTSGARPAQLVGTEPASASPVAEKPAERRTTGRTVPAAGPVAGRTVEVLNGAKRTVVTF